MHRPGRPTDPTPPPRGRRRWTAALALCLALGLGACSGGGGTTTSAGQAPTAGGGEGAGESTTPATTAATTTAPPERALAGRDGSFDDDPVRFEIVSLKRSGSTVALTARLTTGPGADEQTSAQISDTLSDGLENELATDGATEEFDVFDGVTLIDGTNRKRYLTARDSTGRCACDTGLSGTFVKLNAPVVLSATFGAPPGDVRTVDVAVPKFGTFTDVPLS